MYVVCLHPDNADTGPFIDDVPDMTQKVVAMVSTWQELSGGAEPSGGSQCSFDARVAAEVEAGMDMANSDAAAAAIRSADGAALQSQEMVLALSLMNGEETQDVGNEEALALHVVAFLRRLSLPQKRRLMPGASTSSREFQDLFDLTGEACSSSLSACPIVDEHQPVASVREQAKRQTEYVRLRQPTWPEDMVRLTAAAFKCV